MSRHASVLGGCSRHVAQRQQSSCHQNVLCVHGTAHDLSVDERSRRLGPSETDWISSDKYGGAWPDKDEKTVHARQFKLNASSKCLLWQSVIDALCVGGQITSHEPPSAFNVAFNSTHFYGRPTSLSALSVLSALSLPGQANCKAKRIVHDTIKIGQLITMKTVKCCLITVVSVWQGFL